MIDITEKYDWSGVYMNYNERYGWHLTKEVTTHAPVENESQNDSTANDEPAPSFQDSNSTI
tara:strand:+ start:286 stop:468 length:183 start_codon:yes stop_codon:yes gene_type:complete